MEDVNGTAPSTSAVLDVQRLRRESPARLRAALGGAIERETAAVLGLRAGTQIDPREPLNHLGLDSLMAVELRTVLGRLIGTPQPATLLFSFPTLGELVEHFTHAVLGLTPASTDERPSPLVHVQPLDSLSEDELAVLLARRLADAAGQPDRGERGKS